MMYENKMAVAIKVGGKVLREKDDTVFIPFGSEYTLYVKNMNSVRALVRFQIDGTDATDGVSVIVPANGHIELERFLKAGNMSSGLKFKFIERTAKIEDGPRGIKVEDGLIRVEFEFEREPAKIVPSPVIVNDWWGRARIGDIHHHHYGQAHDLLARGITSSGTMSADAMNFSASAASYDGNDAQCSMGSSVSNASATKRTLRSSSAGSKARTGAASASLHDTDDTMDWMDQEQKREITRGINDKGITVGGGRSNQEFTQGSWFPTDGVKHVLVLKILGETEKAKVTAPVTVNTKIECPTCGTKNKAGKKFCGECGTGLEQV
jgi:hypothetical protein